jgi:hypothetical protein
LSVLHNDPGYAEVAEDLRLLEVDLGRSQNAYEHEGSEHPEANFDGFVPPAEVDWNDVLGDNPLATAGVIKAPSYEPTDEEKQSVADDIDLSSYEALDEAMSSSPTPTATETEAPAVLSPDDPDYEGAPPVADEDDTEEECLDARFEFVGRVRTWPHLADVFYAIMMSIDLDSAEPIGEGRIELETLRCPEGSNQWYVDDMLMQNLLVQHDVNMNHPLSERVLHGDYVVWVYDRNQLDNFPAEPTGYIHNGGVFRRPKVWKQA